MKYHLWRYRIIDVIHLWIAVFVSLYHEIVLGMSKVSEAVYRRGLAH